MIHFMIDIGILYKPETQIIQIILKDYYSLLKFNLQMVLKFLESLS